MAEEILTQARELKEKEPKKAIVKYSSIVKDNINVAKTEDEIKVTESAILELGAVLAKQKDAQELAGLIKFIRPFLKVVSKAKAAKLVRNLVDMYLDMGTKATENEVKLCQECIDWSKQEDRTFLRQALEARLIALYFETKKYEDAIQLGSSLLRELKKLDDKALLVEVQLLESKTYHALQNLPRSRAALTSARTTANGIYCPPKLQASLDLQSGILHAADERDFKTAYSYFYEAYEGFDSVAGMEEKAVVSVKYMLLAKIMLNCADEIGSILTGKLAPKYSDSTHVLAMKAISEACKKRSLADFEAAKTRYKAELVDDAIVESHLTSLGDSLMEKNLCRIIEPYSRVQIDYVAKQLNQPQDRVEEKLSQMILDKRISGILDQGERVLIIYAEMQSDKTYATALETIQSMGVVVDALYNKAKKIT